MLLIFLPFSLKRSAPSLIKVRALLPRLHHYDNGTCIVHHIFGGEVCELVQAAYGDAYLTAHFEVPGEMFTLAMKVCVEGDEWFLGRCLPLP